MLRPFVSNLKINKLCFVPMIRMVEFAAAFQFMILMQLFVFAAALCLRGPGALLNFPKLASSLPRPLDLSDKCIQAASNEAAKRFAREVKSQRRLYRLQSLQANTSDYSPQSHSKLQPIAACPNSMALNRPALTPCKIEVNDYSGEQYFFSNNSGEPRASPPLIPPCTPRERLTNRMIRSTPPPEPRAGPDHPLPMNHAVSSSFGTKGPQMLLPKVEEITDPPSMMVPMGEEFIDRSRSSEILLHRLGNSEERSCSSSANEILLYTESGMQEFIEEDMMFNNLPGFVASMYAGMCLVPPHTSTQMLDGDDQGVNNSTWDQPRLWSF
jgi:hypothetical protein